MKKNLFSIWNDDTVIAGYTTDCGGRFHFADPQDAGNYELLARSFGLSAERMVRVHQRHTDRVLSVTGEMGGEGILRRNIPDDYDAILTDTDDLMLCVVTADCVPVFLYDAVKHVIGLAHSGRAGTIKEIAAKSVWKMQLDYGSSPSDIQCILGPYLSTSHHEVRDVDAAPFYESFSSEECSNILTPRGDRVLVDMGRAISISLQRCGVREENIWDCGICTYENENLYSWRREHNHDTQILSFILMKEKER